MMVMKSRFCYNFVPLHPISFHPTIQPYQIVENINFTIDIWQPFIDAGKVPISSEDGEDVKNGEVPTRICGPLLGVLIQIANSIKANLTFIVDEVNDPLPFVPFEKQDVHLDLKPLAYRDYNSTLVTKLIEFSRPLGDAPMGSMLSSERQFKALDLQALAVFNVPVVYLYYGFWLMINLLAASISLREYLYQNVGKTLVRSILFQPASHPLESNRKTSILLLNFVLLSFFFNQFISNKFLNLFTFGIPTVRIESINDLLKNPDVKICVFKGEYAEQVFTTTEINLNKRFKPRLVIANPSIDENDQWETWALDQINEHRMVLFSDKFYVDYMLSMHEHNYTNLFRPLAMEKYVLPYVIPLNRLNRLNRHHFNKLVNKKIVQLLESGLYNYWTTETLLMNKQTTKDRMIFYNHINNFNAREFYIQFQESYHQLKLADFVIFFQLLLILYLLALTMLVGEIIHRTLFYQPSCRLLKWLDSVKSDTESGDNDIDNIYNHESDDNSYLDYRHNRRSINEIQTIHLTQQFYFEINVDTR